MMAGYRKGREVITRRLLYINRRAPHGTVFGLEALEAVLVGAAFEQQVSVLFTDDGVFQLHAGQAPEDLGMKNYAKGFRALAHYEVDDVFASTSALAKRGLEPADLLMPVRLLDDAEVAALIDAQDAILSF